MAVDCGGNLYVALGGSPCVLKVSGGTITTVAGTGSPGFSGDGGPAVLADFLAPAGGAADPAGNVYIADPYSNRIRILTPGTPPAITPGGSCLMTAPFPRFNLAPGSRSSEVTWPAQPPFGTATSHNRWEELA